MTDRQLRVLLVEDVPTDAELEVRELKRAGLRVAYRIVDTEPAFRAAVREFDPEVILSDFSMPHFDGMWALDLARELAPDVPFIFVSGTIGEEYAIRALRNGATDYVLKSNLVRLPAAVERALLENEDRLARLRAEQALHESDVRFRLLVENVRDYAIVALDLAGRVVSWNVGAERIHGYGAEEIVGRHFSVFHPEASPPEHYDALLRGAASAGSHESEGWRLRKDGSRFWASGFITAIVDERGSPRGYSMVTRDITERRNQEFRISRLNRVLAVLSGISSTIMRVRDRQQLFEQACRIAVEDGGFGIAWIGILDRETLDIAPAACAGVEAGSIIARSGNTARRDAALGRGFVARAVQERQAVFSNDLSLEASKGGERRREALRRGYRSLIVLPLMVDSTPAGIMSLFAKEPDFFDAEEIKLLTALASDISFALEHMARQEKIEKLSRIRTISSETNAAIARIHERDALLRETCRIAAEQGQFELVWIGALDEERQEVRPIAWKGFSTETAHVVSWATITAANGTLGEAIRTRTASVRNDIEMELPVGKLRQEALEHNCRSTVCLPLVAGDRVVALIVLFAAGRGFFDTDELALLNELAADVSLALQSIARQERLNYLAYYDVLTGLPNRALFLEHVSHALHAAEHAEGQLVLVLGDIKRFRMINDTLGRQAGDEVLKQVTQRLLQRIRNPENLARVTADYFATFLTEVKDLAEASHRIETLVAEALREPIMVGSRELNLSFTIGISVYPHDGTDAETLFRNAEAALKNAKTAGERYLFYQPQMNARVAETLLLETKLRRALEREQFVLHYQPKIELASGRVSGLEALIRWKDPESGLVPPANFIPILEETGMISEVGLWALRRALIEYRTWYGDGLRSPRVAVNVSPIQLARKDFVDVIRTVIREAGAPAEGLDLEITETLLMEDIESNIAKLRAVRDMGVQIAIDDFGTGYSSLGYLARLPVNALKIDRSFVVTMVNDADSMSIVSTIISLAHTLNLKVIAEGVDSEEQSRFLRLLKCDEIQGYLISRPVPAPEVEALLAARRGGSR